MIYEFNIQSEVDAITEPKHVWVDGTVFRVYTGDDIPAKPVVIPTSVTPRQFRRQLVNIEMYQIVLAYIESLPVDSLMRIDWEYALNFDYDNADLTTMFAYFGVDKDAFFTAAALIQ